MLLVTGGTGLVGSHVVAALLRHTTDTVRATYRSQPKQELTMRMLAHCYPNLDTSRLQWVEADLLDIDSLYEATEGATEVYHTAALVSFSNRDHRKLMKTNVEGTANAVNAALDNHVSLFAYVSSTAALSRTPGSTVVKDTKAWNRDIGPSAYARSKFLGEREAWRATEEGMEVIIVNPSVLSGPGNWNDGSLEIYRRVYNGLKYYPVGGNAVTDARDVATALLALRDAGIRNERFVLAGNNVRMKNYLDLIAGAFDRKPPGRRVRPWMAELAWRGDALWSYVTGSKHKLPKHTARAASTITEYQAREICERTGFTYTPLETSVAETTAWLKKAAAANWL
jgi:nucleoside-diphosphate-sugar epimerase